MIFAAIEAACKLAKAEDSSRIYDFSIRWGC